MSTRRQLLTGLCALVGASAVAACTKTTGASGTTYTLDVSEVDTIISKIVSGAEFFDAELVTLSIMSDAQSAKITSALTQLQTLEKAVSAHIGKTVAVTVASSWVITAENAVNEIVDVAQALQTYIPSKYRVILTAVSSLLPVLEGLINVYANKSLKLDGASATPTLPVKMLKGYSPYDKKTAIAIIDAK